jgi:hypothetical protein
MRIRLTPDLSCQLRNLLIESYDLFVALECGDTGSIKVAWGVGISVMSHTLFHVAALIIWF